MTKQQNNILVGDLHKHNENVYSPKTAERTGRRTDIHTVTYT